MRLDPHSYNDTTQPETTHVYWKARIDFDARVIDAEAVLSFSQAALGQLDLDTRDLKIEGVFDTDGQPLVYVIHPEEPVLGSRLSITFSKPTKAVCIRYRTSPEASALQWLTPAQTFGGQQPFLFSQCQAVHARAVLPIQDTPRIRIKFHAELNVPSNLKALMAAAFVSREEHDGRAVEIFEMPQPIPPYLFALAVGELVSEELGPRSRVWAEPSVVKKAASEFVAVDEMLRSAEQLFGDYEWDRFDLLVMPQSFPYGGMENPRLTFLTPTLLAGDRSLVSVVAHELAHSWTGNLVTNANAEHFWLNEGFTVFAERRILEALYGADFTALNAALGRRRLQSALDRFSSNPEFTLLQTKLDGIDPDDSFSEVPYEKGYLFLRTLEESVGREVFNKFLRTYVERFRFQSITTEEFVVFLNQTLPKLFDTVNGNEWLHEPGVPANAPVLSSERLSVLQQLGAKIPSKDLADRMSATEWTLYLDSLPHPSEKAFCATLDQNFGLNKSGNFEVLVSWLKLAAVSNYEPAFERIEEVLGQVGRMKFLQPLYIVLADRPETLPIAARCYERYRDGYHPISRKLVESILRKHSQ